jgi:CheY-specific phosphatase CheX
MPQLKPATLATIFSEVLASLAFMFTDQEMAEPDPGEPWLETAISYRGSAKGTLRFRCTRSFAVQLSANLLGLDPLDEEATNQAEVAVKEFMNILCGQFVTSVHGTKDVFDLTIPETGEMPEMPDTEAADSPVLSTLCVDGHRVQLTYEPDVA